MRLITLGTGTVALAPARVCAGHHVEAGAVRLLLDCGSGIVHRLAQHVPAWRDITHVALSHFHTDHIGDLPTLLFAWKYGDLPGRSAPLVLIGPAGTSALLGRLADAHGDWMRNPGFELTVVEVTAGGSMSLGDDVTIAAHKVPHTEESVAWSIARGGARLVYSGDTGYDPMLAEWARGA
nr:ribonuclease Z [Gemmatimonadaceae bacterium]